MQKVFQVMKGKTFKCVVLIIGVLLIPTIYGGLYLASVWDAYGQLDLLPVAVVNADKGAEINGKFTNMGDELIKNMTEDKSLDWQFVSEQEAQEGMETGNKYYAVIRIPSDFSSSIASVQTTEKSPATLTYSSNEKRNYIASVILKSASASLESSIRSSVAEQITGQLTEQLNAVPDQLNTLNDGLVQLGDGSSQLIQGMKQLYDGSDTLTRNLGTLDGGLEQAEAGTQTLNQAVQKLPELVEGVKELDVGANQLADGINQTDEGAGKLVEGSQSLTENLNTLHDGLGKAQEGSQTLNNALTNIPTLVSGVKKLDNGAQKLADGLKEATAGAKELDTGAKKITDLNAGINQLNAGAADLSDGLDQYTALVDQYFAFSALNDVQKQAQIQDWNSKLTYLTSNGDGSDPKVQAQIQQLTIALGLATKPQETLASVATQLKTGAAKVSGGAKQLAGKTGDLSDLQDGVHSLRNAMVKLNSGGKELAEGTFSLRENTAQFGDLQNGVKDLSSALTQLHDGSNQLYDGSKTLETGLTDLKSATGQLKEGSQKIVDGTSALVSGTSQMGKLQEGVGSLAQALTQLHDGSSQLYAGSKTLQDGIFSAQDGANQLNDGLQTAQTSVGESITEAKEKLEATEGLPEFTASSVNIEKDPYDPVPNYGSGFAPYFISVSLWTGALTMLMSVYLDPSKRMRRLSPDSDRRIFRTLVFMGIGVAQGMLLAVVVQFGLGLQINHVFGYYASLFLIATTFMSMVQFFIVHLGDVGKLVSMILLVLQLTSTGGTFPVELTPGFFQVVNHFVPMTYSIQLLKEVISGQNMAYAWKNALILLAFLAVFAGATLILAAVKQHKEKKQPKEKSLSLETQTNLP